MTPLTIEGITLPWRHLVVVSGTCGSGKTRFACRVAVAAADQGLRAAIISPESPSGKLLDQLRSRRSNIDFLDLWDLNPYLTQEVDQAIDHAVQNHDLIVVDELPRVYAAAGRGVTGIHHWKTVLERLRRQMAGSKREQLCMVTISTRRGTAWPARPELAQQNPDPDLIFPLLTGTEPNTLLVQMSHPE